MIDQKVKSNFNSITWVKMCSKQTEVNIRTMSADVLVLSLLRSLYSLLPT